MCGAFGFPEMVQATSMSYLKRFYLGNTVMDYHPKNVMYALSQSTLPIQWTLMQHVEAVQVDMCFPSD